MKQLVILRHGLDSEYIGADFCFQSNVTGSYLIGKQLVEKFGKKIIFFSSPLKRAVNFANPLAEYCNSFESEEWKAILNVSEFLTDGKDAWWACLNLFPQILELTQKCEVDCVVFITHTVSIYGFLGREVPCYTGGVLEFSNWDNLSDAYNTVKEYADAYKMGNKLSEGEKLLEKKRKNFDKFFCSDAAGNVSILYDNFLTQEELSEAQELQKKQLRLRDSSFRATDASREFYLSVMKPRILELAKLSEKRGIEAFEDLNKQKDENASMRKPWRELSKKWIETYETISIDDDYAMELENILKEKGIGSLNDAFAFLDGYSAKEKLQS